MSDINMGEFLDKYGPEQPSTMDHILSGVVSALEGFSTVFLLNQKSRRDIAKQRQAFQLRLQEAKLKQDRLDLDRSKYQADVANRETVAGLRAQEEIGRNKRAEEKRAFQEGQGALDRQNRLDVAQRTQDAISGRNIFDARTETLDSFINGLRSSGELPSVRNPDGSFNYQAALLGEAAQRAYTEGPDATTRFLEGLRTYNQAAAAAQADKEKEQRRQEALRVHGGTIDPRQHPLNPGRQDPRLNKIGQQLQLLNAPSRGKQRPQN